ncbi:MAG: hypothetical protein WC313_04985 [Candidatus Kapaibacterium sp.]
MSEQISEYSTTLKSFTYLSYLIIILSILYIVTGVMDGDKEALAQSFSGGLLGLFAGGFLNFFGRKKRTLKISKEKVEYHNPKVVFSADIGDIVLVKSFKEMNRKTENLVVMTSDENILTISTAFFSRNKLISAFNDLKKLSTEYPDITFEDDRAWGENN